MAKHSCSPHEKHRT